MKSFFVLSLLCVTLFLSTFAAASRPAAFVQSRAATTISKMKEVDVEMMAVERVGNIGRGGALITKEQFVMVRTLSIL